MIDVDLPNLEQAMLADDGLHIKDGQPRVHLAVYENQNMARVAESVRWVAAGLINCDSQSVAIIIKDLVPFPIDASTDQEIS